MLSIVCRGSHKAVSLWCIDCTWSTLSLFGSCRSMTYISYSTNPQALVFSDLGIGPSCIEAECLNETFCFISCFVCFNRWHLKLLLVSLCLYSVYYHLQFACALFFFTFYFHFLFSLFFFTFFFTFVFHFFFHNYMWRKILEKVDLFSRSGICALFCVCTQTSGAALPPCLPPAANCIYTPLFSGTYGLGQV